MVEVQVKTASFMPKPNWRINNKAQEPALGDHEWFALVALSESPSQAPRGFVVPRDHVAAAAWIRHMDWLTKPGIPPGRRNTGIEQARVQAPVFAGYENRWDLLRHSTAEVPVLLPKEFRDLALSDRVGLPPGHPWISRLPDWA